MPKSADRITNSTNSNKIDVDSNSAPVSLWRRLTAGFYDWLLLVAIFFVATAAVVAVHRSAIAPESGWFQGLLFACGWLYFSWFWVHGGQTVGMKAWKIEVADATSRQASIGWARASVRYAIAWAPLLPLGLSSTGLDESIPLTASGLAALAGLLATFLRDDRRAWHDLISSTYLRRRL